MEKTIYILWFQGFINAPDIIKKCVDSWRYYNPNWNIILLDDNNLKDYIDLNEYFNVNKKFNQMLKSHLSDIIRTILLKKYGGVWADATLFCNQSLDNWLYKYTKNDFFAFDKPGPDRLISNWFLYSKKNGYIINKWLDSTIQYYKSHNTAHTYFIHHYLFGDLYNSDHIFKNNWDDVPKISADGPHSVQLKMFNDINNETKYQIDNKNIPLYKLTYKCDFNNNSKNSVLSYLYSTIINNK